MISTIDESAEDEQDKAYITEMQAQEATPADLRVLLMVIMRLNDGR